MVARYGGAFSTSCVLHAALALWLARPFQIGTEKPVEVVLLPPAESTAFPGLKPLDPRESTPPDTFADQEVRLVGADLDRIASHLPVLFPFVTPGLAVEAFFPRSAHESRLVFENPYAPPAAAALGGKRLDASEEALQAIVDRTWTRGNRWAAFDTIRTMTGIYDADDSRLATLIARYREENALQPYADGAVRDLRLWAQLGLAADHVSFISFVRNYTRTHPPSKVTTELLLLLDTLTQANGDALATLVETNQPGDLGWTRRTDPRAYFLALQIEHRYSGTLDRLHLGSRRAVEAYYDQTRLALLSGILRTTPDGYRAGDVRFLMGSILWRRGRHEEALRLWREMTPTTDDVYATVVTRLRAAARAASPDVRNIAYILKNEDGRWLAYSDDRLRRFGYRFDKY